MKSYENIKLIRISNNPYEPTIDIAGNLVLKLGFPREDRIEIKINPAIMDYQSFDKKESGLKQIFSTQDTKETITLDFDFEKNNIKKITVENVQYEIKLMSINEEIIRGKKYPKFEFQVSW